MLEQAWRQLVASSEGKNETAFMPGATSPSTEQTLQFISSSVEEVKAASYEQSFWFEKNTRNGGGYLCYYQMIDTEEGEEKTFQWNMTDVDSNDIALAIQRNQALVKLPTAAKADVVAYSENGGRR